MRLNDINLESEIEVVIDHDSKKKCKNCRRDIWLVTTKTEKIIPVELVSLAKWDVHNCEEDG